MKTSSKPWYRKSRDAWYVQINGKQIRLAQGKGNRAAAKRAWLALMNGEPTEIVTGYRLATCFDEYLASLALESRRSRKPVCDSFIKHLGKNKLVGELKRQDIVGFLKPSWSDSTTRTCIRTVDAAINRAVKLGKVASNPFQGIDKPAWTRPWMGWCRPSRRIDSASLCANAGSKLRSASERSRQVTAAMGIVWTPGMVCAANGYMW